VRGQAIADQGAFTPYGLLLPFTMIAPLPGPYAIRNFDVELVVVHTNTTPNTPVRGAAPVQGLFRLAADDAGLDIQGGPFGNCQLSIEEALF